MTSAIDSHQRALAGALARVIRAEESARLAKCEMDETARRCKIAVAEAETEAAKAWDEVRALMAETGEVEVTLPGHATDYRIYWSTPRESVKADEEACPDEFVKTERKPRLKEIGDYLKGLRDAGEPFPNWASLERGEPSLCWKSVKRGAA